MSWSFLAKMADSKRKSRTSLRRPRWRNALVEHLEERTLLAADFGLEITDGDSSVAAGDTVVYNFEYSNVGDEAGNAVLHASLPRNTTLNAEESDSAWSCEEGWWGTTRCSLDLDPLDAQATGSAALAVTIDSDISDRVSRISVAGVISGDSVRRDRNDYDRESTPIGRDLHDLRVELSDGDAEVSPDESVVYTVDYANDGTGVATSTVISVRLPRGTSFDADASGEDWVCDSRMCTLAVGDVAAGEGGSSPLAVTVDAESSAQRLWTFANISAAGTDGNRRDNYDTESTRVIQELPDLAVSLGDSDVNVEPGSTTTYTIDYANNGGVAASGVVLTFWVSRGVTVSTEGTEWTCENGRCTLDIGDLAAGASGTITLEVTASSELPARRRSLFALAHIRDDGENGRDANRRDNYSFMRTRVSQDRPDDITPGGDDPAVEP